ncbi:MAG: glycosyltransferase family 4 protein [Stellaceae bacterium]
MKRIIFLNRYFHPDHSATSQVLSDLAFHLAAVGHAVQVFTSRQLYDNPVAELPAAETVQGVAIRRLSATRFGRAALLGRGVDYASFYVAVWCELMARAQPGDIVVAKTDPPLLCLAAAWAARRRGLLLVNWLQDIYPEVAMRLRVPLVAGPLLLKLRDMTLRGAAANVVVGEGMAAMLRGRGVAADCVQVIQNWCDDDDIRPVAPADNELRREWGLTDRFAVGYSGNLGRGHEYATLLEAAMRLRDEPRIVFLFVGGGSRMGELRHQVAAHGLDANFRFLPYQDRARLRFSLGAADVHWLSLRPELEGLIVPSKFYGIAAAGRPVIAVTAPHGEMAGLVRQHRCGFVVAPGDGEALAAALRELAANPETVAAMGFRARAMLDAQFTRRQAFARWERLFDVLP